MHKVLLAALTLLPTLAHGQAERFYPDDLDQDGKATLSPGFSPDGTEIFFTQSSCRSVVQCPQELYRSQWKEDGWSRPQRVELTAGDRVDWPLYTPLGDALLFSWRRQRPRHRGQGVVDDFDLYLWPLGGDAPPRPLDEADINRIRGGRIARLRFVHNESSASLTREGDLYFFTERLDEGPGERDIFVAKSNGQGGFLEAEPLPAPINSPAREDNPWVSADGNTMLLSIDGRLGSIGGDLYVSRRTNGEWSEPRSLGPEVNSPYAEFAGRITPDGKMLVFTSTRPVREGGEQILQVWQVPVSQVPAFTRKGD
jgi:Tol biopolymer transport system component